MVNRRDVLIAFLLVVVVVVASTAARARAAPEKGRRLFSYTVSG